MHLCFLRHAERKEGRAGRAAPGRIEEREWRMVDTRRGVQKEREREKCLGTETVANSTPWTPAPRPYLFAPNHPSDSQSSVSMFAPVLPKAKIPFTTLCRLIAVPFRATLQNTIVPPRETVKDFLLSHTLYTLLFLLFFHFTFFPLGSARRYRMFFFHIVWTPLLSNAFLESELNISMYRVFKVFLPSGLTGKNKTKCYININS